MMCERRPHVQVGADAREQQQRPPATMARDGQPKPAGDHRVRLEAEIDDEPAAQRGIVAQVAST